MLVNIMDLVLPDSLSKFGYVCEKMIMVQYEVIELKEKISQLEKELLSKNNLHICDQCGEEMYSTCRDCCKANELLHISDYRERKRLRREQRELDNVEVSV